MPGKAKGKTKTARTAAKKAAGKKTVRKSAKKTAKKAAKKPAGKIVKKAAPKPKAAPKTPEAKPFVVTPGPPPTGIPPVEEPVPAEEAVGVVTHYYSHLGVAVIQVNTGTIRTGDRIHIKGHTSDFSQAIDSMEFEHQQVEEASAGMSVGLKVVDHAREHDVVYRIG